METLQNAAREFLSQKRTAVTAGHYS